MASRRLTMKERYEILSVHAHEAWAWHPITVEIFHFVQNDTFNVNVENIND